MMEVEVTEQTDHIIGVLREYIVEFEDGATGVDNGGLGGRVVEGDDGETLVVDGQGKDGQVGEIYEIKVMGC